MKKNNLTIETTFTVTAIVLILFTLIFQSSLNDETQMVLFGLSFVFGGFYKAKEGVIKTIENKALNVEFLMIIAALGAFILKNYAEGAILIFIFALSGLLEKKELQFDCQCSKDNFKKALITLGKEELEVLAKDEEVEVVCQFCNKKYIFTSEELVELAKVI